MERWTAFAYRVPPKASVLAQALLVAKPTCIYLCLKCSCLQKKWGSSFLFFCKNNLIEKNNAILIPKKSLQEILNIKSKHFFLQL